MCVEWAAEWEKATENIIAYKVVRKGFDGKRAHYCSPTDPSWRADQGYGNKGSSLPYKLNRKVKSEEPGIYCIAHPMQLAEEGMALLKVVIPKGTKIRRGVAAVKDTEGNTLEMRTINALCVKPVKEFKGKVDKRFLWPTTTRQYAYTWSYTTSACTTGTTTYAWYPG